MKNIKQTIVHVLAQSVILGMWTGSVFAAGWDEDFHTSFMNNIGNYLGDNRISCVATLGTEVYIGSVNAFGPPCYVWRYKETDHTWALVASFDGAIYSLS